MRGGGRGMIDETEGQLGGKGGKGGKGGRLVSPLRYTVGPLVLIAGVLAWLMVIQYTATNAVHNNGAEMERIDKILTDRTAKFQQIDDRLDVIESHHNQRTEQIKELVQEITALRKASAAPPAKAK